MLEFELWLSKLKLHQEDKMPKLRTHSQLD